MQATELVGTDVERVALVKKGAARLPFRITKSEDQPMLDLTKLGLGFLKSERKAGVLAAVVRKGADLAAITPILTASGLSVEKQEEKEGMIVFAQTGVDDFETGVVRINDDLGLVVSGLTKAFSSYDFESTSFGDVFKAGSFYPSIRVAQEMLTDTIHNIMYDASSPTEATAAVTKAVDEFKEYTAALASALPVHAFKADVEVSKADKKGGKWVDGKWVPDAPVAAAKADSAIEKNPTHGNQPIDTTVGGTNNGIEKDPAFGNETPHATGGKSKPDAIVGETSNNIEKNPAITKSDADKDAPKVDPAPAADALAALTKTLTESIAALGTKVEQQVSALKTEVDGVAAKLAKAEEALNGTVAVEPGADKTGVRKTDTSRYQEAPPLMDTAYDTDNSRAA